MFSLSTGQRQQPPNSSASVGGEPASSAVAAEGFNDWGGRGYDDFVPGEVTKIAPYGDETT